jgi:CheY-like chemotaxis protein/HPt (histidine-containing phosphotransfer) domain-containing protein
MSPEVEMLDLPPTPSLAPAAPTREQALRDGTLILLAEDHPVNREVVLRQLSALGYVADAVVDGRAALEALARTDYGLLLTDCNMPVMDGYALARQIRQEEPLGRHLPIIALTANAMDGEITRCLSAGMDDYMSKPVTMETLREQLRKWMATGAQTSPAPMGQGHKPVRDVAGPVSQEAQTEDGGEAPALDRRLVSDYFGGDQAATGDFLKLYLKTMQGDCDHLCKAIAQQDREASALLAHRMKGAALSVGAERLARVATAIESSAATGDWPAIGQSMAELLSATRQVERACA